MTAKMIACWRTYLTSRVTCRWFKNLGIKAERLGGSSKSPRDRSADHLKSLKGSQAGSIMLRHNAFQNPQEDPFNAEYIWEPLKSFQKALDKQEVETLAINDA